MVLTHKVKRGQKHKQEIRRDERFQQKILGDEILFQQKQGVGRSAILMIKFSVLF